ncbi:MAG: ABC transporter ATP-binding protein [Deltaproteobacteria bacterium]|nr:ABC transporter ATP-binding protein [Deltaproteobacteria bacterium]
MHEPDRNNEPAISCTNLVRRFGKGRHLVTAVDHLDLAVPKGKIYGLLGPNGAGKTTAIRMLTGQIRPTEGRATVAGFDTITDRHALHRTIGVVFDVANMYDPLSGRQNLLFFGSLYGTGADRVDELIDLVGMKDAADRKFKTYSKGMKQRMVLARALLHQPSILFLDEPVQGLDPASHRHVRTIIERIAQTGATVLVTTHSMELADELCHHVFVMHQGKLVASGSPSELKQAHGDMELEAVLADGRVVTMPMSGDESADRLAAFVRSGAIEELRTKQPTLEDVFLKLTGTRLT